MTKNLSPVDSKNTLPSDFWRQKADALSLILPLEQLNASVIAWVQNEKTASSGSGYWLIACSGGADSLCLALLLFALFPERRASMALVHFDHCLRGDDSAADMRFVQSLARNLGVGFFGDRWQRNDAETVNEADARRVRFDFFRKVQKQTGARILFLGHQRDDILETMMIRLARGSGTEGLAAPRPVHLMKSGVVHLRPLLDISRETIVAAMSKLGIPWCEDQSNVSDDFLRNRLRNRIIPHWQEISDRDLASGAAESRQSLEADHVALENWLDSIWSLPEKVEDPGDFTVLINKPEALLRRAVNRWLDFTGIGHHLRAPARQQIIEGIRSGSGVKISAGSDNLIIVEKCRSMLYPSCKTGGNLWNTVCLAPGAILFLPNRKFFTVHCIQMDDSLRRKIFNGHFLESDTVFLALTSVNPQQMCIFVRRWNAGDRYRPLRAPGSMKLQDQFVNRKISQEERGQLPVVINEKGTLLWVPGLPPNHQFRIQPQTEYALRLTYRSL